MLLVLLVLPVQLDNLVTRAYQEHPAPLEIKDCQDILVHWEIKVLEGSLVTKDLQEMLGHLELQVYKDCKVQLEQRAYPDHLE